MCAHEKGKLTDAVKRKQLKDALRSSLEGTLEQRVDRWLEVNHQGIIANHYFAAASAQCIELYRDGYFLSAVMVSQAVNEGIWKLVAQRNEIKEKLEHRELMKRLVQSAAVSQQCADASKRIWRSFRNDVHHMNPKVGQIDFRSLAKKNLQDLAVIEKEVFRLRIENGRLIPHHAQYWDLQPNGTVPAFLRLDF